MIVSRDLIRHELGFVDSPEEKVRLTREQEQLVTDFEYNRMKQYILRWQDFIVDDTNLGGFRKQLIDFLRVNDDVNIIGVNFKTPLSTCIKRREGQIPEDIMRKMYAKMSWIDASEVDELINI